MWHPGGYFRGHVGLTLGTPDLRGIVFHSVHLRDSSNEWRHTSVPTIGALVIFVWEPH